MQAYVDWSFRIGVHTAKNQADGFRVPHQWQMRNVSQYTDAVKESLQAQALILAVNGS